MAVNTKLWVDDIRPVPEGFDWAKTYQEAIDMIKSKEYDFISLDHDLGCFDKYGRERTGYDVLVFLEASIAHGQAKLPKNGIACHSANPAGRSRIQAAIEYMYGR